MAWDRCNQDSVWRELEVRTDVQLIFPGLEHFFFFFFYEETDRRKRPRLASLVVPVM